ncbi:hypothetical protein BZL29_6533 [Mycobacterium kansasii]|nr:hypothetical protein BZL29_6533 [Mycobacterium kansasii]
MNNTDIEKVLRKQRLRSLQGGSILRVGVAVIMFSAMPSVTDPARLPEQAVLLGVYAV